MEVQRESKTKNSMIRARLSKVLRQVRVICAVYLRMRLQSIAAMEDRRATLLYVFSRPKETKLAEKHEVLFDRWQFSRQTGSRLPLYAKVIATKPPEMRSPREIERLYNVLNTLTSFRRNFTEDVKWQICQAAWYTRCEKDRVVLRQGHSGFHFYLIYTGSVFVQVERNDPITAEKISATVACIRPGASFGEIALLRSGIRAVRTASVICAEPTELFQIDKLAFVTMCRNVYEKELDLKIRIARCHKLFSSWPDNNLKELCFLSQLISYPTSTIVDKDLSQSQHIYLISQGTVELMLRLTDTHRRCPSSPSPARTPVDGIREGSRCSSAVRPVGILKQRCESAGSARTHVDDIRERSRCSSAVRAVGILKQQCESAGSGVHSKGQVESDKKRPSSVRFGRKPTSYQPHIVSVGHIKQGESSDLRVLLDAAVKSELAPVILVSQGVKLLRMSCDDVRTFAPKDLLDDFLSQYRPVYDMKDEADIREQLGLLSRWENYKHQVWNSLAKHQSSEHGWTN